jgi:hypothetical protein
MTPLYEQRSILIAENVELLMRWLALLPPDNQRHVIRSMVARYTLPQLRAMHDHVAEQVDIAEQKQKKVTP